MTVSAFFSRLAEPTGPARGLWAELRGNRRAQLGLIVIGALIVGFGLVPLHEAGRRVEATYARDARTLAQIAAVEAERDWPQRAAASAALRRSLEGRLWVAPSDGIAQANLQAWITDVAREIGLPLFDIRIETARPQNLGSDIRQITATISAQPSEAAVIAMLERLERAPHLAVIARMHLRQRPTPILELVLVGYARVTGAEPGAAK